jgi:hypothetical protein
MEKLKDNVALGSKDLRKIVRRARELALENYFFSAGIHTKNNEFYQGYRQQLINIMDDKEHQSFLINNNISATKNGELLLELAKKIEADLDKECDPAA